MLLWIISCIAFCKLLWNDTIQYLTDTVAHPHCCMKNLLSFIRNQKISAFQHLSMYVKGKYEVCKIEIFVQFYLICDAFVRVIFSHTRCYVFIWKKNPLVMFRAVGKCIGLHRRLSSPNQFEFYVAIGNVELSASALQLAAVQVARKSPMWSLGGLDMWDHVVYGSLMSQVPNFGNWTFSKFHQRFPNKFEERLFS